MNSKTLVLAIALLGLPALTACELYIQDRDDGPNSGYGYCDETGCWYCDDYGCYPDGGAGSCETNADCAAGCYCADGTCFEAGFCDSDSDCPRGFVCDSRASCVPEDAPPMCTADSDCPRGSFCDETSGTCVSSVTCAADGSCEPGFECDDRGTCVPQPCAGNDDCLAGTYCGDAGTCEPSTTCSDTSECLDDQQCDDRNTCVPCGAEGCPVDVEPGNCYDEVLCDALAPTCPASTLPGVVDGCYSGFCIPEALCPDEPPFACEDAADEASCTDAGCESVYVGIDCTDPQGGSCTGAEADCTCDHFEYGFCRDAAGA